MEKQIADTLPSVKEAVNGTLDPQNIPANGATVKIEAWTPLMKSGDWVYLYIGDGVDSVDDVPIGFSAVDKEVVFVIPANEFVADADEVVRIHYKVKLKDSSTPEKSKTLELLLKSAFEAPTVLDLSSENYIIAVDKPPTVIPSAARKTRKASWGSGTYSYASDDPETARVDKESGEVTALRNGACRISATDSENQTREYTLTIKGIREVHYLNHSDDWDGQEKRCAEKGLQPISPDEAGRLWTLYYYPDKKPVATYLGWRNHPIWTGTTLGADTANTYDLNGASDTGNVGSESKTEFLPVVGISKPDAESQSKGGD
ncbi:Ig-like domain-containing protein [Pseudomonas atacamensis]|jgi:hypothetical protein|uniref:Ig-like domain-containing protein n=1 Tax=Pseudomonas atacamensis TaxID=2565368 RepID=UPI003805F53C